mgnify:CR=1 FL=1
MFFLPLPDRKLASKGVFVIFIGLGFCPGCAGVPDKSGGSGGDGAPVSAAFLCAPVCREPIARTDIDGEKYLAAIVIWQ